MHRPFVVVILQLVVVILMIHGQVELEKVVEEEHRAIHRLQGGGLLQGGGMTMKWKRCVLYPMADIQGQSRVCSSMLSTFAPCVCSSIVG